MAWLYLRLVAKCGLGFIQADVVKWREGIWEKRGPGKGRVIRVGERLMIAEVLQEADEEGWCLLLVRECVILESTTKRGDKAAIKRGEEITRRQGTIMKGRPQRMLWTGERQCHRIASAIPMTVRPGRQEPFFVTPREWFAAGLPFLTDLCILPFLKGVQDGEETGDAIDGEGADPGAEQEP